MLVSFAFRHTCFSLNRFLANFIGTMLVLPGMFRGTLKKEARIPFGPLLIVGFLIAWFMGDIILSWYMLLI